MLNAIRALLGNNTTAPDVAPNIVLPLEIHGLIIDTLASENASLNAYAQTCSGILALCRQHIFAQVAFNLPWKSQVDVRRIQRFVKLLMKSPEIADIVRRVQLNINELCFRPGDEKITKMLAQIASIEHLGITTYGLKWGEMLDSPELGPLIQAFISSPNLSSLELRGIEDFKMDHLNHCARLTKVQLKLRAAVIFPDEEPPSMISLPPQLSHLTLDHVSSSVLIPAAPVTPIVTRPPLKSLQATMRALGVARIISAHVQSLEEFTLHWSFSFINPTQRDFSRLGEALRLNISSLKFLKFVLSYNTNHEVAMDNIAALLLSISTPASHTNAIQDITITLSTGTASRASRFAGACGQVDIMLSSSVVWPSLKRVAVETRLIGHYPDRDEASDTLKDLPNRFPRLSASRTLNYQFIDADG
ncbi:hypothetical protein CPB83DRAFT_412734 [Crepidotus variabilis]|uniref:Uncharacterized protein n=1 Tax=Crepidotus variabilis TaxID=179855 RepID=A0A9P6ERT2_9AGAR|nr:hypothetical protein CPB83DRAFT_412734 [Crepidotus variabilis]